MPPLLLQPLAQAREEREHASRSSLICASPFAPRERAHLQVLLHRHPREDPPPLGRLADAHLRRCGAAAHASIRCPFSSTSPSRGLDDARDRPQRRRLARAVGADQRDDLARLDLQRDALERVDVAVVRVDVAQLERRHRLDGAAAVGLDESRATSCRADSSVRPPRARFRPRPRPRYASITRGLRCTSRGVPSAIFCP